MDSFEEGVHKTIQDNHLILPGQVIVAGVSGGKDSSVLLAVLHRIIYERWPELYKGCELKMCAVDEGIVGYRKESLDVVYALQKKYGLDLVVVPFKERFGRTLDELVAELHKDDMEDQNSLACSFCGILRRNSLTAGALSLSKGALVATGHNADDNAETTLLNVLRGDWAKLRRSADLKTDLGVGAAKIKPLGQQSQRDIVMYAHHAKVPYFSTECPYAVAAQRGIARQWIGAHPGCQLKISGCLT